MAENRAEIVSRVTNGVTTQATLVKKAAPKTDYKPANVSPQRRVQRSFAVRLWSVRHSRALEWVYGRFADLFLHLHPVWKAIGYERVEAPVTFVERHFKGFMFDCRMCGQCVLSSTGMSCPMNCPKNLRNGPCGGVRPGGFCEVKPEMRCVWVEGWEGARRMRQGLERIAVVQPPVDRTLEGSSSWLRVAREKAALKRASGDAVDPGKSTIANAFKRARIFEPASAPLVKEPAKALADQAVGERTSVLKPRASGEKAS